MNNQSQYYSRYFTYIKPFLKNPIVKSYGTTIFTIVVMIIFIVYAIKPTVETILVLQKKLANSNEVLQKITQKTNNLSKAQQNYTNLNENTKIKIETAIPDSVTLRSIIQTLEQTAKKYEASTSALQIQPLTLETQTSAKKNLSEIGFTFNVEGDYQKLILLLQDLKASDRLISIDNVSLSKPSEGKAILMSLSGKAFYLK